VHVVYSLAGGGAVEARAREEIRATVARGHRVIAVTDSLGDGPRVDAPVWASTGARLWRGLPGAAREISAMYVSSRGLERAVRDAKPDVIVFHNSTLAWPVTRMARRNGARSVLVVQALIKDRLENGESPYSRTTTNLYRAANRAALRLSDRVVCVSEHMARVARDEGVEQARLRVVPNPVDTETFRPSEGPQDIDVLFVGRLSTEKGVDVLLDAVAGVPEAKRVVVAGDGPLRPELEARARSTGARVEFTGWVGRDQLPALYPRARVQVVPSRSEPQGVVVLEALASGTPVIGSDVGGIPEMIEDASNGWLVEPGRSDQLRAALLTALSDRERLEGMRAGARESAARFSLTRFPELISAAYLDD
jgi:glycosyltransferase involved in cell wall biosynthesis